MVVDEGNQFNYSREELDQMRRRAEIRKRLKREFYSYYKNPLAAAYRIDTYDPAHQRLTAALSFQPDQAAKFYKVKHTVLFLGFFIGVPALFSYYQGLSFYDKVRRIRTGEYTLEQRMRDRINDGI